VKQCCNATDSKALFKVPNNGGYETTPEEEWNFVVNPDLAKTYPGGRRGTKLDVYNLAHGAQKHGGARLDIPLDSADNRLAEVAKQNACSTEELVDSVKTVVLRWGRATYLSEDPLKRAIKKLVQTQEENSDTIRGLEALVKLGAKTLKELGKKLGEALENAPRVQSTGERSFVALAECVKDLASREMLEALARYSRTKLMEAKACEEDVIGLRLYTGALRSRSCLRALSFPNLLAGHPRPRRRRRHKHASLDLPPQAPAERRFARAHTQTLTYLHTVSLSPKRTRTLYLSTYMMHIFFISFVPLCL